MIRDFEYERVFNQKSTQEDVYKEVSPLVTSCLDGYNVTILAYGQTGSGKTYTMKGSSDGKQPGVNTSAMADLFRESADRQTNKGYKYSIKVSVLEVYNNSINDIIESKNAGLKVDGKAKESGSFIKDLR